MTTNRTLRQSVLDLLRFPLAVIVVIVHVFSLDDVIASGTTYHVSGFQLFQDACMFIDAFLRGISVPIYFFISGYVFFWGVKFSGTVYKNKIKNRFKSLFVPYMIWNLIAVFFIIFKQLPIFESFLSNSNSTLNLNPFTIFECFWKYNGNINPNTFVDGEPLLLSGSYFPVNAALWYLRDLMIIILTAPAIYWLIKKIRVYAVYLSMSIYFASIIFEWPNSMILGGYFYFSWGAYMSIFSIDMMAVFFKWFKLSIFLYLFNCIMYIVLHDAVPEIISWIKTINSVFALLVCFNIAAWLLQNTKMKVSTFFASSSFFIYVSHCVIYERLRKILFILIKPESGIEILLIFVFTVILTILSLLLTFYVLKKYCPSVLKVVAGRK